MKQEMVPALMDNEARIALDPANPYKIITKPHGHGTSIVQYTRCITHVISKIYCFSFPLQSWALMLVTFNWLVV